MRARRPASGFSLLEMLLVRATGKEIATAGKLIEESQAAIFLRRNH